MINNVRRVHEDALKPDSLYAKKPLQWFRGRSVKLSFSAESGQVEHMWVKITEIDGPHLVGNLDNDPVFVEHLDCGDTVILSRCQIEMVDLSADEWREEVDLLLAQGDYFNRWLGYPGQGSGFDCFVDEVFTPRSALKRWAKWSPSEDEPLAFLTEIAKQRQTGEGQ
jgi:hypothetical protein